MEEQQEIFVIRKGLKSGNAEVDAYIEELHNHLLEFDTSNIKKLVLSLDSLAGVLAEDVEMLVSGGDWDEETGSRLRVLSDSKDSKSFERVMVLFSKIKDFEAVSKTAKSLVPDIKEERAIDESASLMDEIKMKGTGNKFEEMQEKHFSKRKGKMIV